MFQGPIVLERSDHAQRLMRAELWKTVLNDSFILFGQEQTPVVLLSVLARLGALLLTRKGQNRLAKEVPQQSLRHRRHC